MKDEALALSVLDLPIGAFSEPVREGDYGYHIFRVEERIDRRNLDEVREDLVRHLISSPATVQVGFASSEASRRWAESRNALPQARSALGLARFLLGLARFVLGLARNVLTQARNALVEATFVAYEACRSGRGAVTGRVSGYGWQG